MVQRRWHRCFILIGILAVLASSCRRDEPQGGSETLEKRLDKLRSVPYTTLTAESAGDTSGVLVFERAKAWPGYNLYCSRITPEALLLDMEGTVVHRWHYPQGNDKVWDHAIMLEGGDLLVLNKFENIIKLDRDSDLIWDKPVPGHHDVVEAEDATLYVCLRETRTYRELKVRFPIIAHLTSSGDEIGRWSSYEHLGQIKQKLDQRSFLDTILDGLLAEKDSAAVFESLQVHPGVRRLKARTKFHDYFHLNTITLLPGNPLAGTDSRFAEGNLLICFRNVNQIAILEKSTKEVLWAWGEGVLEWPHHPTMVENGNILVFDNGVERKYSRVLELNPITQTVEWGYTANPPRSFFTYQKGSAQRLPNGNTLICEGDMGRSFEVTRDGEIVWEWINPEIKDGRRVQIYRMIRYAPQDVEPWLGK
jgi:hypothetical protein